MLDDRVVALARKSAAPTLKDLDGSLEASAAANRARFHGHGYLHVAVMEIYAREVGRRAQVIWKALHRAHGSLGAVNAPGLRDDLIEAFRVEMDAMMSPLRARFDQHMKDAPQFSKQKSWTVQLQDAKDHEFARYEAEIEHYVASLETAAARGTAPAASYVIHGNVGAVVTGPGAVTNVVQNINPDQREALIAALAAVRQAIAQAPELTDKDRAELAEVADDATAEVTKESPNTRRLGFALQTLAATVQGIASGPQAYEVLRTAAAAIGVSV